MVLSEFFNQERVRRRLRIIRISAIIVSGIITAAALPGNGLPGWCAWFALVPFILALNGTGKFAAALYGWLWGSIYGWGGFFWLHEIHPAAGILIGPVFGAYWMIFSWFTAFFWGYLYTPPEQHLQSCTLPQTPPGWRRSTVFIFAVASLFVFTEFMRWHILPWNAFGVTQWQTPLIRGLAAQTGVSGISFILAGFNAAVAVEIYNYCTGGKNCKPSAGFITAVLLLTAAVAGSLPAVVSGKPAAGKVISVGVIQPDLPRRTLDLTESEWRSFNISAIKFNSEATAEIAAHASPELVLWPETSISIPFRSDSALGSHYRAVVAELLAALPDVELLIGTIDWQEQLPGDTSVPGTTNTALLIGMNKNTETLEMRAKYDKQHLVPFGEYVPFRALLPEWVIRQISMGDDLAPGGINTPVHCKNVRMGVNICFEDIFDYISREFAQNGAEILAVITNDSWYPGRAEQYQHLANSVFRSVETGLPMVRCGSNSGSVVVHPDGHLESLPGLDPFEHISAAGVFHVTCGPYPGIRLFRLFGNWMQFFSIVVLVLSLSAAVRNWVVVRKKILGAGTTR